MLFYFHSKLTLKAIFVALLSILFVQNSYTKSTANLTEWLKNYDEIYKQLLHNDMLAQWTYEVNLTDENLNIAVSNFISISLSLPQLSCLLRLLLVWHKDNKNRIQDNNDFKLLNHFATRRGDCHVTAVLVFILQYLINLFTIFN